MLVKWILSSVVGRPGYGCGSVCDAVKGVRPYRRCSRTLAISPKDVLTTSCPRTFLMAVTVALKNFFAKLKMRQSFAGRGVRPLSTSCSGIGSGLHSKNALQYIHIQHQAS